MFENFESVSTCVDKMSMSTHKYYTYSFWMHWIRYWSIHLMEMRVSSSRNNTTSSNRMDVVFARYLSFSLLSPLSITLAVHISSSLHYVLLLEFKSNVKWKFALFSVCYSHIKSRRENKRKWCSIKIFITLKKHCEYMLMFICVLLLVFSFSLRFCYSASIGIRFLNVK